MLMHRSLRFIAALLLGAAVGCQNEGLSPAAVHPSFATGAASASCAANPTVTAFDDTTLRAALASAHPGDVIAVSGTIEVTADDTIATDNVTLTCATPGSGLVARGLEVVDMITVLARGVVVDGLVLDGSRASDAPWFAFYDVLREGGLAVVEGEPWGVRRPMVRLQRRRDRLRAGRPVHERYGDLH